jgi:hypothetical protein
MPTTFAEEYTGIQAHPAVPDRNSHIQSFQSSLLLCYKQLLNIHKECAPGKMTSSPRLHNAIRIPFVNVLHPQQMQQRLADTAAPVHACAAARIFDRCMLHSNGRCHHEPLKQHRPLEGKNMKNIHQNRSSM